jgi:hypothetical protein
MTFKEYIQNPMGRKNAVFSKREMFKSMYSDKLDKILVREKGNINYKQYVSKKGNYFIYLKIPSEVIKNFYYDVVIEFSTKNPLTAAQVTLDSYDVKFFSNDPAFVFTFAHAFIKNDMFIKELTPKMSELAVKNVGKEKNPKDDIGYVKSIFFAYLWMQSRGLFKKASFTGSPEWDIKQVSELIMHADRKIQLRQQAQKDYDSKVKKEKELNQNRNRSRQSVGADVTKSTDIKTVKKVLTSKVVGKTKSGKLSKTVHVIGGKK